MKNNAYAQLLIEIKETIRTGRQQAIRQVNQSLIEVYWQIGQHIVKSQEEYGWGKRIVEDLSTDLKRAFPAQTGFSARNIWDMRRL